MAFCTHCGNRTEPAARFCVKCGRSLQTEPGPAVDSKIQDYNQSDKRFARASRTLVSQLNLARAKWFQLLKEVIADELPEGTRGIVNDAFEDHRSVTIAEQGTPAAYPFNSVAGDTVEAAVICWQIQNAVAFAMQRKTYIKGNELDDLMAAVVEAVKDEPRWVISLGGMFGESGGIDDDSMAIVLGHYLLGDPAKSSKVAVAREIIRERGMPFLRALTYIGTATAFGDARTMQELMASMNT